MRQSIFIGVKGSVIALDRATGEELWNTRLKGSEFVNVFADKDVVLASTKGEMFCLNAASGDVVWQNTLPGKGLGIISIATASGSTSITPSAEQSAHNDAAVTVATASN